MSQIQFIDLGAQQAFLGTRIDDAIKRVLEHGRYIMGPEVKTLEAQLSEFGAVERTVSCSNGTDAITLPLMAMGIGPGDAVFLPSFTFAATAEVVALAGATPVFIDVRADTFNLDTDHLAQAIEEVIKKGELTPKAVLVVDLFGQIADYPSIKAITDKHGLKLISDAAQGYGSTLNGNHAGHWADVVTTSFFPAKPLGCYGDGGAVLTNDHELADIMESLRVHGKGTDKYDNVRIGLNARLDTIQAAILIEKLAIFAQEITQRNIIADRYNDALKDVVVVPRVIDGGISTWAQYTIKLKNREAVQANLQEAGVPSVVYYAKPLHEQTAYKHYPVAGNGLPVTEQLRDEVLSLPMHPYMTQDVQEQIIDTIIKSTS